MDSIRKELKKGVTLNTVFTEKFKTNTLSVNFVFPFLPENNSYYALIVQILKQGCRKYPSVAALAGRLDTLYASDIAFSLSTVGESQVLTVSADFLRNRCLDEPMDLFKEIVDCLFEMLRYPLLDEDGRNFRPDIIESEKRHLRDMIRAKFNNKTVYAMDRCRALMCKGEPSAVNGNGTEEMLSKIDISRLYEMYKEIFKKSRMELFFVGDEKHERVEELVSPLLSLFSANSECVRIPEQIKKPNMVREFNESADTVQSKLCMGFRLARNGFVDESVLSKIFLAVFSASPVSKLFIHVREEKSLCYYCNMQMEYFKGIGFVNAGIAKEKKEETVSAVLEQLECMKNGSITEDELLAAKTFYISTLGYVEDSPKGIEAFLLKGILLGKDASIEEDTRLANAVTVSDLIRFAKDVHLDTVYLLEASKGENSDEA